MVSIAITAQAYNSQKLEKNAKFKMVEARAIALKAHPEKITDEELEKEKGGSGLRYSFDITQGAKKHSRGWCWRNDWSDFRE